MKRLAMAIGLTILMLAVCMTASADTVRFKSVGGGRYRVVGQARLVHSANYFYNKNIKNIKAAVPKMNKMIDAVKASGRDVTFYTYFIESSRSLMFNGDYSQPSRICSYVQQELHTDVFSRLEIGSFDQLCDYYYSTDTHWNYKGSYQGYRDVMRMLTGSEDICVEPKSTYEFPFVFNGVLAKSTHMPISEEKFTVYIFDGVPGYTNTVNGKKKQHDSMENYFLGLYKAETYTDHYDLFYGPSYGENIFDSGRTGGENILVFVNSFADPVLELMALHYDKIIAINLNHYKRFMEKDFDLGAYIDAYGIRKVLFLGDAALYAYPKDF